MAAKKRQAAAKKKNPARSRPGAQPITQRDSATGKLPGIISFPLQFNESASGRVVDGDDGPGLVIEYLRSYESYGEAVFWVTRKRLTT